MSSRIKTVLKLTGALALTFSLGQGTAQSSGLPLSAALASGPAMERAPLLPAVTPPGTAFTYQGQLKSAGAAVNATCDFVFSLFDAPTVDAQVGTNLTQTITVTNGLFTAVLDFGPGAMNGDTRWLATQVRCPAGSGAYTLLTPRQVLAPAPMALALPGLWTLQNPTSPNLIGGYSGNFISPTVVGAAIGGGGVGGLINRVTADYGTLSGGTNNSVSGERAVIGGGTYNSASGQEAAIGGGSYNSANGLASVVGGGSVNNASGPEAAIGGGSSNSIAGSRSAIAGGYYNSIPAPGQYSFIGAGVFNSANGFASVVSGGSYNTANGLVSAIGGGSYNSASGQEAAIGGGSSNNASAQQAAIGGGYANAASGSFATVPGGRNNLAQGATSFAVGRRARALHDGSFVWGDSTDADVSSSVANQFVVRATGGFSFATNSALSTGCFMPVGGIAWNCTSDKNAKANFVNTDSRAILARLSELPITTWNAKSQDDSIRHIGPMAQDFAAAFNVGENNTTISVVDAQGVAFAAIQGLNQIVTDQRAQIGSQQGEIAQLKAQNAAMDARLAALERGAPAPAGTVPVSLAALIAGGLALLGLALAWRFRPNVRRSHAVAGSRR